MTTPIKSIDSRNDAPDSGPAAFARRLVEAADKPLMFLAFIGVLLYLANLRGFFETVAGQRAYDTASVIIDVIFIVDLILKLAYFRRSWVRSPWFLIDILSCLPALIWMNASLADLGALRIVRPLRLLRVLRTVRLLRSLRQTPVFAEFLRESSHTPHGAKFILAMNVGVAVLTGVLLFVLAEVDRVELQEFREEMYGYIDQGVTGEQLAELGGTTQRPKHEAIISFRTSVDGQMRDVYFSNQIVDERTKRFEFYLVTGVLLASGLFIYIMTFQLQEVTFGQLRALLNIALPIQVARHFVQNPDAYSQKQAAPATVIFMDFVGFTKTCEKHANEIQMLSEHLERAMDAVVEAQIDQDLIIDKFIGDAVMSFRGGPLVDGTPGENARRVVRAALDSARRLSELEGTLFKKVKIGGASGDSCLVGAFGTSKRLSYTVLGDAVNLAARLEPASGQCHASNLFCERTRELCGNAADIRWRRWGRLRVPGKETLANVYEAFTVEPEADFRFIDTFHRALEAFETRSIDEARRLFEHCHLERPGGDPPSEFYISWCDELVALPPAADWQPVREMRK